MQDPVQLKNVTVRQLVEALQKYPDDYRVVFDPGMTQTECQTVLVTEIKERRVMLMLDDC